MQSKGPEEHTVLTVNGRISLRRRRYATAGHPLDAWLDAACAAVTVGVREMACRLNLGAHNFDTAADNLARAAQVRMCGESLRGLVEAEGRAVQRAAQRGALPLDWDAGDCQAHDQDGRPTDQTRLYLGSDGVMVPVVTDQEKRARRAKVKANRRQRGKKCQPLPRARNGADGPFKEFKIVTLYDEAAEHRLVSVTRGDCQQAGKIMRRDAGRVRLDTADDKVALVDGARWIVNQLAAQSLPLDAVGLDFYHLAENVHKARRAVFGEADPKDEQAPGNVWARDVLQVAKHDGYEKLVDELRQWHKGLRGRGQRGAAAALLGYVTERREMILYPDFVAAGRQIGSGPTESMCKATTQRIKGCGRRWDGDNAEAVMALEALEQSGGWRAYWDSCLLQAV